MKSKPSKNSKRKHKAGSRSLDQLVRTALERRAETWRQNTDDPHGINTAVYVALLEVKEAISDAMAQAGGPNNRSELRQTGSE